jgi:signal transduction histidine kinase
MVTPCNMHINKLADEAEKKHITISLDKHCINDELNYDWDQMLQVFLNLMMNAMQHMQDNGHIAICILSTDSHLMIQVADDGSGISDTQKENIFEPFYTSRKESLLIKPIISAAIGDRFFSRLSIWADERKIPIF